MGVVAHRAIPLALELAAERLGTAVEAVWTGTESIRTEGVLEMFAGIWCVPGSPYRDTEGALRAISFARRALRPFLGTCGGFQHALLEYARNVLGIKEAAHAETDPDAPHPLVAPLECSLVEQIGVVNLRELSLVRELYGAPQVVETYHCRYGLNRSYEPLLASGDLRFGARDEAGDVRALELEGHPFFLATLFQPERAALKGSVPPVVAGFLRAAMGMPPSSP